jgi:hypothetical protein
LELGKLLLLLLLLLLGGTCGATETYQTHSQLLVGSLQCCLVLGQHHA